MQKQSLRLVMLAAAVAAVGLAGCSSGGTGGTQSPQQNNFTGGGPTGTPGDGGIGGGADGGTGGDGGIVTPPPPPGGADGGTADGGTAACFIQPQTLTEAQAVRILQLANDTEIAEGKIAQAKGTGDANSFGATMVTDHTAANQALLAAAQKDGVTPAESPLSARMTALATQDQAILNSLSGETFNTAYLDLAVSTHAEVLAIGDSLIQPSLHSPDVVAAYNAMKLTTQQHLKTAIHLQSQRTTPMAPATPQPSTVMPLNDNQIAGALTGFEAAQVAEAQKLVSLPGQTPTETAYTMQNQQAVTAEQQRTNAAIQSGGLTPQPSPLTTQLAEEACFQQSVLQGMQTTMYLTVASNFQIANDARMLFYTDALFFPQVTNAALKAELTAFRNGLENMMAQTVIFNGDP